MGPEPWIQQHWDWRAACNFIGGGTGSGLYMVMAAASLMGAATLPFGILALLFVGFGLFMVLLETGRPERAPLNVFFHPQTSWMTREAMVAPVLFGLGALGAWFGPMAALPAAVVAATFLYCQARILKAAKGIPAWREPAIVPLIMVTGVTEGAGLFLLSGALVFTETMGAVQPVAAGLLLVAVVVRAWAWTSYRRNLGNGNAPQGTLEALDRANLGAMVIGNLAPVALIVIGFALPGGEPWFSALAGASALAGGWFMKFIIITRASYNQGFAITHLPERGAGGSNSTGAKPGW